jgi:DNA (cytosine-5)-methyltransferase 1
MLRVIREIKPTWVLGENVPGILSIAGKTVCEDLEREGYAVTVFNFEAAAVGARHRRDRVFFVGHSRRPSCTPLFVADTGCPKSQGWVKIAERSKRQTCDEPTSCGKDVANTDNQGLQGRNSEVMQECASEWFVGKGSTCVADTSCKLREWDRRTRNRRSESPNGSWRAVESGLGMLVDGPAYWLDGYWRVEPNIPRVATGVKNRVDRLKCLGNAVVPQQAYPIFKAIADIELTINKPELANEYQGV